MGMVLLERVPAAGGEAAALRGLVEAHVARTGSTLGRGLLDRWGPGLLGEFVKVRAPRACCRALGSPRRAFAARSARRARVRHSLVRVGAHVATRERTPAPTTITLLCS